MSFAQKRLPFEDLPIPQYVATKITDVSGCDSSGNIVDITKSIIANDFCGPFSTYDCNSGTCVLATTSASFIGLIIGIIVALIVFLLIGIGIGRATK
jgi:hypothetical protein